MLALQREKQKACQKFFSRGLKSLLNEGCRTTIADLFLIPKARSRASFHNTQ